MKKFLAALVAITPLAVSGSAVAADKTLTIASWAGPAHTMNANLFPQMISELEGCSVAACRQRSNLVFPRRWLFTTVRDGVADISWIVYGYTPGKFDTTKLVELPGSTGTAETMSYAFHMTYEKYLAAAKEAKGVKVMAAFTHGPGHINTKEPLNSYKDVVGMKLRVGGGVATDVGNALGVAGVGMPAPAVYESISSGVTGVFFRWRLCMPSKSKNSSNHLPQPSGHVHHTFGLIINADTYDGLSDAHRTCVDKFTGPGRLGHWQLCMRRTSAASRNLPASAVLRPTPALLNRRISPRRQQILRLRWSRPRRQRH